MRRTTTTKMQGKQKKKAFARGRVFGGGLEVVHRIDFYSKKQGDQPSSEKA